MVDMAWKVMRVGGAMVEGTFSEGGWKAKVADSGGGRENSRMWEVVVRGIIVVVYEL